MHFISGNGKILHKIRHHEEDIHDITWAPPGAGRVFRGDDEAGCEKKKLGSNSAKHWWGIFFRPGAFTVGTSYSKNTCNGPYGAHAYSGYMYV